MDLDIALAEIEQLKNLHAFPGFNLWVYMREFMNNYWGFPLGIICILGFVRSIITHNRKRLVLFFTTLAVLYFASRHRYVEAKYILYSFPLFAVLGSYLFIECFGWIQKRYISLIIILVLLHPLYLVVSWDYEHAQKSITIEAREWIEENIKINAKILLDNVGNAGPKLENSPENLKRQYQRAVQHNLMKADYLKLKLESSPSIHYNIIKIDSSAGTRKDYYQRYRLWQDVEEIGHSQEYYQKRGFEYIIVTERYSSKMVKELKMVKEFINGNKSIRIYKID
jgi:hypothetical protein